MSSAQTESERYVERIAKEVQRYREVENVHDLPEMYHYWSAGHLDPLLRQLGWQSLDDFFIQPLAALCQAKSEVRVVSLGSGNGDLELSLARLLRQAGHENFRFRRLELNDAMRERARADAVTAGLQGHFFDEGADLNRWTPDENFDAVIANHSLHHLVELEHVFETVRANLPDDGVFIVNDMVGRNGHMRWPEALDLVEAIWAVMPDRYRYNHQLKRHEKRYENWDCSTEGFEGIRAQDILPLLSESFHAEAFLGFANVIDLFVDRGFGHNFDPGRADDCAFIDAVARLDEAALTLGIVKPTHLLAHYRVHPVQCRYIEPFSPAFCVRRVAADAAVENVAAEEGTSVAFGRDSTPPAPPPPAPPSPAAPRPSIAYRVGKAVVAVLPPVRRLRQQRDALAAEVQDLRRRLEVEAGEH